MTGPSTPGNNRMRRRIAIVGTNTQHQLSLSLLLKRFDYEVSMANTATQALELIAASRHALVITELTLPGISGMDLFRLIKQNRKTAFLPVVFAVAVSDAASEKRCLDMGAAGCVTKPIQVEELYRTVQEIIEPRPRSNIRIGTRLAVAVNNEFLDCGDDQCDIDLSEYGMYVPTLKPLPRNRQITVQLRLQDRTIQATGCVLFSHASGPGVPGKTGMGLKFINMTPQDQSFIRNFIHTEVTRGIALRPSTWT
jgi:CheY-like chemotaxis protein